MWKHLLSVVLFSLLATSVAFGQVGTTTTATSAEALLSQGFGAYNTFSTSGVLAGLTATVFLLVSLSKVNFINTVIKTHNLKWLRPVLALVAGFLAGLLAAMSNGRSWTAALPIAFLGLLSGGSAVALHELLACFKGERR